jgi:hypothetical protein
MFKEGKAQRKLLIMNIDQGILKVEGKRKC